jgi:osmotically-inducible protein OsmY
MRSDDEIERDVKEELRWAPDLDETDIAISVRKGVVTLTGFVRTYMEKNAAEAATKRITGVAGIANDLDVRLLSASERSDPEIARAAVTAVKTQLPTVAENIQVVVRKGWVNLEGHVEWHYQKNVAEDAVKRLTGVRGVVNLISIKPYVQPFEIKRRIEESFSRSAELDANRITVEVNGGKVVLQGSVLSWAEREEAARSAWSAPGVTWVDNRIVVAN